ncbi:sestrin homolog [Ischnura elegans]|uniref:sestrin homolog n=1 Tax=Ischnura elegans TaxID=197161 RepID=UPI001ED8A2DA|nr:sestrin homolog [Ischnura elegans]
MGQIGHNTHMLFIDAFLQNNRLDHVTQVIGYHPTYLDVFLRTQNFILRGDGPLPYDYRHFIAIMAAGRHQCSYLINLQKQEFLLQGGDQTWLKGLSQIPQKLRDLYEINKILAHRPWLLNKSHIEKLTKGKDSWSLAEVVHAIVLLAHFHSLSSFVFGCGVNEEVDRAILASPTSDNSAASGGRSSPTSPTANSEPIVNSTSSSSATASQDASSTSLRVSPHSASSQYSVGSPSSHNGEVLVVSGNACSGELEAVGVETLMQRMKSLSERAEEFSAEERTKRFEHVESQSAELLLSPAGMNSTTQVKADIGQFVDDPTFLYQDFARRGEMGDIPTFRVQDYSWDDHGYSLVNRLYNDVGNLLDEKFKTAYNLTYYTMGGRKDVDTSRFRRAIWNYIQCMFGIRHDDYDYGEVNQLLERSLKAFIKSACCFPERVTKKDYDSVLREFKHSEKVHVNLMVLEARMQAELLYALRAVMRYMT